MQVGWEKKVVEKKKKIVRWRRAVSERDEKLRKETRKQEKKILAEARHEPAVFQERLTMAQSLIQQISTCARQCLNNLMGNVVEIVTYPNQPHAFNALLLSETRNRVLGLLADGDTIVVLATDRGSEILEGDRAYLSGLMRCQLLTYFIGICLMDAMKQRDITFRFAGGVVGKVVAVNQVRCRTKIRRTVIAKPDRDFMMVHTKGDDVDNHYLLQLSLVVDGKSHPLIMYVECTGDQLDDTSPTLSFFMKNQLPIKYKNVGEPIPPSLDGDAYLQLIDGNVSYVLSQLKSARFLSQIS